MVRTSEQIFSTSLLRGSFPMGAGCLKGGHRIARLLMSLGTPTLSDQMACDVDRTETDRFDAYFEPGRRRAFCAVSILGACLVTLRHMPETMRQRNSRLWRLAGEVRAVEDEKKRKPFSDAGFGGAFGFQTGSRGIGRLRR